MLIVHEIEQFKAPWEESSLTLGVFDGLHRGHQALLKQVQKRSRGTRRARVLVTYHPHPDLVLGKRKAKLHSELFTYQEKLSLLQRFDLDAVVFLPFTMELARMTALRYLKDILIESLKAKRIIIGYDQKFGRGRKGNITFLKKMSHRYHYKVKQIDAIKDKGEIVSSSRIRSEISAGNIKLANRLLGHDFFLTGTVFRGHQRGTGIGFPTANLEVAETKTLPGRGVYSGIVEWGSRRYRSMMNVGHNPTFGHQQLIVEAHILDFSADLYGESIRLYFRERLRDEKKFNGIEDLKSQLVNDREKASRIKL